MQIRTTLSQFTHDTILNFIEYNNRLDSDKEISLVTMSILLDGEIEITLIRKEVYRQIKVASLCYKDEIMKEILKTIYHCTSINDIVNLSVTPGIKKATIVTDAARLKAQEALTQEEKEYLKKLIKAYGKTVEIVKRLPYNDEGFINFLRYNGKLTLFLHGDKFLGMDAYREYTLSELDLEEKEEINDNTNYKITLSKILDMNPNYTAIHCDTEEKANDLLIVLNRLGKKWLSGESYLADNNWNSYKAKTCYGLDGSYGDFDCYDDIYDFDEVDLNN